VVVVASLSRNRSSLAIGNIIGSAISNILGAFSLGLLFHSSEQEIIFDRSSKIYSLLLLILTTFLTLVTIFGPNNSWRRLGIFLLIGFIIYVGSIAYAISRGSLTAPEASDSSDDDSDESDSDVDNEIEPRSYGEIMRETRAILVADTRTGTFPNSTATSNAHDDPQSLSRSLHRRHRGLTYHVAFLIIGFMMICIAGYVLSHTSTTICDEIGMSDILFGMIILSIATTLPEKFIAVLSGARGHGGILVANTVGSNIFLLSLCMGIMFVVTEGRFDGGSVNPVEMGVMLCSTMALTATVWFGAKWSQWIGGAMLMAYIAFLVLEVTVIRKV
jgi:Ca2+/Na+ antiporter